MTLREKLLEVEEECIGAELLASNRDHETKRLLDEYKIMQACFEWFEEGTAFLSVSDMWGKTWVALSLTLRNRPYCSSNYIVL